MTITTTLTLTITTTKAMTQTTTKAMTLTPIKAMAIAKTMGYNLLQSMLSPVSHLCTLYPSIMVPFLVTQKALKQNTTIACAS